MNTAALSTSTLPARWRPWARSAWVLISSAALVLFALGLFNQLRQPPAEGCTLEGMECPVNNLTREDIKVAAQMGFSAGWTIFLFYGATALTKLPFLLVGFIIFWRKSEDWVALLLSLTLILWVLEGVYSLGWLQPAADALYLLDTIIFFILPFIFPNGRFVPGWTRWIILPYLVFSIPAILNPKAAVMLTVAALIWFAFLAYAMIYRYRRVSTQLERQQTKWVISGFLGSGMAAVPWIWMNAFYPASQPSAGRLLFAALVMLPVGGFSYLFLSGSIGFAILRYRLYDIDILIRRTLVYSALTALLALVYFGGVTLLQSLFTSLSGQQSPAALVISTLLIAALFNPLRRSIQEFIDRRFYRQKYDAEQALAKLAAAARDEVDIDQLKVALLQVVEGTMQPERMSLWLKD